MIVLRGSQERGQANHGWLDTRYTFSFSDYMDPRYMGFSALRVINEDKIAPGMGFGTHPHRDMEILTWILEGALEHKDSLGSGAVIRPGEIQRMTAGTGIAHSEFNPSRTQPVHLLQIWILPEKAGLTPGYEQRAFSREQRTNTLRLLASRDGRDGSVTIHQDVSVYTTLLSPGKEVVYPLAPGRRAWVQVARGSLDLGGGALSAGDGAALVQEQSLTLKAHTDAEILLFDLP